MGLEAAVGAERLGARRLGKQELVHRVARTVGRAELGAAERLQRPGAAAVVAVIDDHGLGGQQLDLVRGAAQPDEDSGVEIDGERE